LIVIFPLCIHAWNIPTHKLIAEIAYQHLGNSSKSQINCLLKTFKKAEPNVNSFEQLAAWPDILHSEGISAFNSWHFIDQPLNGSGAVSIPNAVWAVNQAEAVLQDPNADPFMKAWFLAFLAHVTGDLHQPLHAVTRISPEDPQGDHGGNFFAIAGQYQNLHEFWDSVVGLIPAGASSRNYIVSLANKWQKDYPESFFKSRVKDINPQDWAQESFTIAKDDVYQLPENSNPNDAYIAKNQQIAKQRVVLAGYRLAYLLNQLFDGREACMVAPKFGR
jgi:hypothetical protein